MIAGIDIDIKNLVKAPNWLQIARVNWTSE